MGDVCTAPDVRPVIYVTGFGPFAGHPINASQAAVELLPREDIEKELGVRLITEIVDVEYEYVKKTIPQRWKDFMPKVAIYDMFPNGNIGLVPNIYHRLVNKTLTVHVGVSNVAETLALEQLAHNTGYEKQDNCGCVPQGGVCHSDGSDIIQSSIQMDVISSTLNKDTCLKVPCAKSTDPGRFLCDFTYYLSLKEDKSRSAFIHVPTLHKFTAEEISSAVVSAIKEMYLQVLKLDTLKEVAKVDEVASINPVGHTEGLLEETAAVV